MQERQLRFPVLHPCAREQAVLFIDMCIEDGETELGSSRREEEKVTQAAQWVAHRSGRFAHADRDWIRGSGHSESDSASTSLVILVAFGALIGLYGSRIAANL